MKTKPGKIVRRDNRDMIMVGTQTSQINETLVINKLPLTYANGLLKVIPSLIQISKVLSIRKVE